MDRYPKLNFIPTNLIDWKRPWVGMFIKWLLLVPTLFCVASCLYSVLSYACYKQKGYIYHTTEDTPLKYEVKTEEVLLGGFTGYGSCYPSIGGKWYADYDYYYDKYERRHFIPHGSVVSDYEKYASEESLENYREEVLVVMGYSSLYSVIFLTMICLICGFPKRPKDVQPLHDVADYCQKYSYWGIFRRKKTPKFVFFVKDNKFGILDVAHYSVFLPARYDFLEWREKKKYLNAIIDGRNCIIDIYGKELK